MMYFSYHNTCHVQYSRHVQYCCTKSLLKTPEALAMVENRTILKRTTEKKMGFALPMHPREPLTKKQSTNCLKTHCSRDCFVRESVSEDERH